MSGELRSVPLRWDPVLAGDVGGYAVERSTQAEGPFQRIAVVMGRFSISHLDRGTDLAQQGARARDRGRSRRRQHLLLPRAPLRLVRSPRRAGERAADRHHRGARRSRRASSAPTASSRARSRSPGSRSSSRRVTGYVVSRSPSASGNFLPIARLDGRFTTTFVDRGLGDLRVFYYSVAGVNGAGGDRRSRPPRSAPSPSPSRFRPRACASPSSSSAGTWWPGSATSSAISPATDCSGAAPAPARTSSWPR